MRIKMYLKKKCTVRTLRRIRDEVKFKRGVKECESYGVMFVFMSFLYFRLYFRCILAFLYLCVLPYMA